MALAGVTARQMGQNMQWVLSYAQTHSPIHPVLILFTWCPGSIFTLGRSFGIRLSVSVCWSLLTAAWSGEACSLLDGLRKPAETSLEQKGILPCFQMLETLELILPVILPLGWNGCSLRWKVSDNNIAVYSLVTDVPGRIRTCLCIN